MEGMDLTAASSSAGSTPAAQTKKKSRRGTDPTNQKRRCISTACVACRRRKSKCDGQLPSCAACSSVYGTECIYNPNSDHRRKGVYREKVDSMKAQSSTLQIIVEAILNATEEEVPAVVNKIRTCDNLDTVAQELLKMGEEEPKEEEFEENLDEGSMAFLPISGEQELAGKMGELRLENGSVRFIGGTSHLIYLGDPHHGGIDYDSPSEPGICENPITSWTRVTTDPRLIMHLMNMYFNYHYPYFTTLSRKLFWRDFMRVNAMLALGCHFTDIPGAFGIPGDSRTKGDHFFAEAKRLIVDNDEYEKPRLVTVQALALMSVREAGCAREAKGWVYSGMSFRMALDIGLNLEVEGLDKEHMSEEEIDARRITFWGCFLFDKTWSNYLGRLPQLPRNSFTVSKIDVFPDEDAALWAPFTDKGFDESLAQPSRTRAVALHLSKLCEISSDILVFFYHPSHIKRASSKSLELKKLGELHQRLEEWRKNLPKEFEPKEGLLPNVILMLSFFHLQYIHLFRPFLKYAPASSPLPSHISPRRICTANAGAISKLMRLYKKSWNLRQICNIAVYMIHSACTVHLLNLPEKTAKRDLTHGLRHLEEIAEDWLCARRTLSILSVLARKWKCELPEDADIILKRTDERFEYYSTSEVPSPGSSNLAPISPGTSEEGAAQAPRLEYGLTRHPTSEPIAQPAVQTSIEERLTMDSPMSLGNNNPLPDQRGNMDSREWLLSDSARLHQSFGSWDMRQQAGPGNQIFMFNNGRGDGVGVENPDLSSFDSLTESLTTLNAWLPSGLE
ncbi:fungal specific transcription factor domain-containing protein [Trichoderma breve]|uniref:Fungal specific transcription factor domain-containing protein n=1 Tax=Trichoderma breve TaxID=2034170 RepID=A0A9W9EDA3_9HYPO|nr:fungal specific transcription factor domain-containing protein [Trichoderma breve]KAJ4864596.1 fungal specific transcription factor domain-containing protein [Trichoderma breve]